MPSNLQTVLEQSRSANQNETAKSSWNGNLRLAESNRHSYIANEAPLTLGIPHGIKGFVIPTKSFVKIGITKIFCYSNEVFSSINKSFGFCSKIFGCSNKQVLFCP